MKNLKIHLLTGIVAVTTFFSCNSTDETIPEKQENVIQEDDLIERNIVNLSSVDASKLAKRFYNEENGVDSRSGQSAGIKDIQTVYGESGKPLMYVVNYENNQGFTVISASKNYVPVLAYSDEGNLDITKEAFGQNTFFDEYKARLETVAGVECDSLRQKYAISWSLYEKAPDVVDSRAYTDAQIQQELNWATNYYTGLGYEVHSLNAATSLIPGAGSQSALDRANGFINDICEHTPPQYDCMDVTLLLVKRTYDQYGPYISTAWHQYRPYCIGSPTQIAGCVTIAVTQLMYYYRWPSDFNWDNIREDWGISIANLTDDEAYFMNTIRLQLNLVYKEDGTDISIPDMVQTFEDNDYNITEMNYSRSSAKLYMKSGLPLIMYARNENDMNSVHVWICDGYRHPKVQYAAYMIDRDFGEYTFYPGMTDDLGEYFHLNMGDGYNMWYYQDEANYNGGNYSVNRKMYVITKKEN